MTRLSYFLLGLLLAAVLCADAGGPGPAPWQFTSSQIFDASSSPTVPNYLTVDSSGAALVKLSSGTSATQDVNVKQVSGVTASSVIGAPGDAAWAGSGNGTQTAILKGIFNSALTTGTAGTPSSQVVSVQGVSGGTPVKTSAAPSTIDASFVGQTADFTIEAATANLRVMGWTVREDAGTAAVATVVIRHDADGTCDSTSVVAFIELDANQSAQMYYGDRGLAVASGLCADVLAGSVSIGVDLVTEAAP